MKMLQWFRPPSRKRGIALIVVVGALALTTVLLIAMFSVTESEYRATQSFVAAQSAKQYGDMAVSIVQAQIQDAQNDPTNPNQWTAGNRTTHATQPGAATVFSSSGAFLRAHKLYSSSNMVATSLSNLVQGNDNSGTLLVPTDWNNTANPVNRARFVDLNEPVVRASISGTPGSSAVYFPVIDPRAAYNSAPGGVQVTPGWEPVYGSKTTKVEGFSYVAGPGAAGPGVSATQTYTGWASGAAQFDGVVVPTPGVDPNQLRLPMPVEWMYVLKDGTFGTLDAAGFFVPAPNGSAASVDNPIVGRMGFWTDDESCKININTATEPTFSGTPYYFSDRDRLWAHYPASTGEYQRYPGHPATVALSAVLYPAHRLDAYHPEPGMTKTQIVDLKNSIYDLAPKVARGGSQAGTVPFVVDEINGFGDPTMAGHVDLTSALRERLYATIDEMLFKDGVYSPSTGRAAAAITSPDGRLIFDHDTLERTRFFLTAQSRAPEFSIHGLPRICMWPVADESAGWKGANSTTAKAWRTNFDNMIALCATIKTVAGGTAGNNGAGTYYFRRLDPHHSTADITGGGGAVWDGRHISARNDNSTTLARNSKLLDYLEKQLSELNYPRTGGGTGTNFEVKYGIDNVRQLAVEIFDYIRCINLYDGVQARWNNGDLTGVTQSTAGNFGQLYDEADVRAPNRITYTNQRATPSWTGDDDRTQQVIKDPARTSDDTAVLPGHGTVTPAAWKKGKVYMGFGRFVTLSEIGLHFICTADGGTNTYNTATPDAPYSVGPGSKNATFGAAFDKLSGGGSAVRVKQDENAQGAAGPPANYKPLTNSGVSVLANCNVLQTANAQWWSNFPPLKGAPDAWVHPITGKSVLTDYYGCDTSKPANPVTNPKHPSYHPGLYPENWNMTLAYNTPLEPSDASGKGGEKRIQANVDLETFCPMSGWTKFYPEFTIVLDGDFIGQIKLKSGTGTAKRLFNTAGPIALKSNNNHYELAGQHSIGGHATPAALISGRAANSFGVDADGLPTKPIPDPEYDLAPSKPRDGLVNYALASNFITVKRDEPMTITFPKNVNNGVLKISIYDSHDWQTRDAVQIISVRFNDITAPTPELASPQGPTNNFRVFVSNTTLTYNRSFQGPHWWVYNNLGCIARMKGKPDGAWTKAGSVPFWQQQPTDLLEENILQETRGRLHNQIAVMAKPPAGSTGRGFDLAPYASNGSNPSATGSVVSLPNAPNDKDVDVVRTMVPAVGDYRMIAARYDVPENMWVPHPMWRQQSTQPVTSQIRTIHSYTGQYGNVEPGFKLAVNPSTGADDARLALVSGAYAIGTTANADRQPDLPGQTGWATTANSFGDFDTTISSGREGPFINKPDEGNFYAGNDTRTVGGQSITKFYRSAYFKDASGSGLRQTDDWRNGVYMTPNRLVASPVMFGSLPTGIWNTGGNVPASLYAISGSFAPETAISAGTFPARPWQTLLFRPHSAISASGTTVGGKANHPGQLNPMDHYILDLFFMPVVEPYAISEPLSVAGRLNLNYQVLPFTNIRRATGMHALMKGEFMTSIPSQVSVGGVSKPGIVALKAVKNASITNPNLWDQFINENPQVIGDTTDNVYVHRPINVEETLAQFDERFKLDPGVPGVSQGPFRSASQLCELHLIPAMGQGESGASASSPSNLKGLTSSSRKSQMDQFWQNNPATGDNVRERPYSNLYSRITTRSNTFRVHFRAQVIKKARTVDPTKFDPDRDSVLSEYRGSTLLERYIDPNDTNNPIPDYATKADPVNDPSAAPLDTFYKFRALETKRFNP